MALLRYDYIGKLKDKVTKWSQDKSSLEFVPNTPGPGRFACINSRSYRNIGSNSLTFYNNYRKLVVAWAPNLDC